MKNFALIGAAGYIAPRHMDAIKRTDNLLLAALDRNDSVGVIDSYFPTASFFTEFERFDRHIEKLKHDRNQPLDYVAICTPNYLHDAHIRFALRQGADAICEKPLVINPWNLDALEKVESQSQGNIHTILQLRLHPTIIALKKRIESEPGKVHDIDLTYITSRGKWYYASWKGDAEKSGGICTNIGIHFFDMLTWIFGDLQSQKVHLNNHDSASGVLRLEKANVRWFLSINAENLPTEIHEKGQRTYRAIHIDGQELEFSQGFTELHLHSYQKVLAGEGFGLNDARKAVEVTYAIRNESLSSLSGEYHPFAKNPQTKHPFGR